MHNWKSGLCLLGKAHVAGLVMTTRNNGQLEQSGWYLAKATKCTYLVVRHSRTPESDDITEQLMPTKSYQAAE